MGKYTLMHKNHHVADVIINDVGIPNIIEIIEIHNKDRLPFTAKFPDEDLTPAILNSWWLKRSIPASRNNINYVLEKLNISVPSELINKAFGLSLSEQYWVNPHENLKDWTKINFFTNPFSEDLGNILIGGKIINENIDFNAPENSLDGVLEKRWKIIDDKRYLIKGGNESFNQEPINEKIATIICQKLNINHVAYDIVTIDGKIFSKCQCFIDENHDFITARPIIYTRPFNNAKDYEHMVECLEQLGITNPRKSLEHMIILDYLMLNTDRHHGNFGIVRNANTLSDIKMAPIFDTGTSLWCKNPNIHYNTTNPSLTFSNYHEEQIKLVKDLGQFDFSILEDVSEQIFKLLCLLPDSNKERNEDIANGFQMRLDSLM